MSITEESYLSPNIRNNKVCSNKSIHESHLRVLDAVILRSALSEGTTVHADDGRMSEVRVHPVETGRVRDGDV